jgi:hypothetical protein
LTVHDDYKQSEAFMQRPFEHTLTPDDRVHVSNWLVGISLFYTVVILIMIGLALVTGKPDPDIVSGMPLP